MNLKPHHFHEDPQVLHVGTCPNRSYYIPYAGEKEAESGCSSRVISLNDTWAFQYFNSYKEAISTTPEVGMAYVEEDMDQIPVPSCWEASCPAEGFSPSPSPTQLEGSPVS